MSVSYEESGVSREEGYKAVSLMKEVVAKTMNNNVLNNIGSFEVSSQHPVSMNMFILMPNIFSLLDISTINPL